MKYKLFLPAFFILFALPAFSQNSLSADTVVSMNDVIWTKTEIEASFPGGEEEWNKFMFKVLKKNIDALTDEGKSGTCRVRFIVDTTGKVSNVEALNMKDSVLARIVVDAIVNGPKWIPDQQNGRLVKAYKEQPVTFN
jgi:protein TonB